MVSNLFDHRNDVEMFKTQVKPPTASEWFHCTVVNIMTSFLWSVRVQTKENCCRFVFTITVTAFTIDVSWKIARATKKKKIEPPSCHFHGLHSYTRQFATWILSTTQLFNFFQASLRNCINYIHCDDHFFISVSFPQFIYNLFIYH